MKTIMLMISVIVLYMFCGCTTDPLDKCVEPHRQRNIWIQQFIDENMASLLMNDDDTYSELRELARNNKILFEDCVNKIIKEHPEIAEKIRQGEKMLEIYRKDLK